MSDREQGELITIRCYTKAHRTPLVIGKLGDFRLPSQVTIPQMATLVMTFIILWNTRNAWDVLVFNNGTLKFIVYAGGSVAAGLVVRYAKVEGRKPYQAFAGMFLARIYLPITYRLIGGPRPVRARWTAYFGGEETRMEIAAAPAAEEVVRKRRERAKERKAKEAAARKKAYKARPPKIKVKKRR